MNRKPQISRDVELMAGYEIIHGLTPANYAMPGSPGGLLRIDRVFHSSGYTNTFGAAPLVFGAFPSLHSGCAVMEALFLSHFFPSLKPVYWVYVGILWWSTMYLSHHYLIDLTGGACLSVIMFYITMPEQFKDIDQIDWSVNNVVPSGAGAAYEMLNGNANGTVFDAALPSTGTGTPPSVVVSKGEEFEREMRKLENETEDEERDIGSNANTASGGNIGDGAAIKNKTKRSVSWGETKVLGEQVDGKDQRQDMSR